MFMNILTEILFFSVKEVRIITGHAVTIAKEHFTLDIRKLSFSQRTVNEWNTLSADCMGASCVNVLT